MTKKLPKEEVVNHFGAVRMRVNGSASLYMKLHSLDEVNNNVLLPLTLKTASNIESNRLSNFTQQRAKLEIRTTNFGEFFTVSKIVIFVRPVAKSFPE